MQGRGTRIWGKGDQQINPDAHKTQIQISCKGTDGVCTYELYVFSFWGFCLEPRGSWKLSSTVSPHSREHSIELCSGMLSLPLAFSFPSCSLFCYFVCFLMVAVGCLVDWITGATSNINSVQLYLCNSAQSLSTPSPIGRQTASQNMLTCAKSYWYELPEQLFYPIFYKTDIPHKVHTWIFIQTHLVCTKKAKGKSSKCKITGSMSLFHYFKTNGLSNMQPLDPSLLI